MTKMITPKKPTPKNARIFFILDRSGSMSTIVTETIGGFNAFVAGQRAVPGDATFTLIQFDHEYLVTHDNVKLNDVPELTLQTFTPRGMTAMYDAVGLTISKFKNDNPPDTKTIVVILTDGEENSSKEYSYMQVKQLISEVQAEHDWEVLFIGANMNAQNVASGMGIASSKSATFDYSKKGTRDAIDTLNFATSAVRGVSQHYADGTVCDADNLDMTKLYGAVKTNASSSAST